MVLSTRFWGTLFGLLLGAISLNSSPALAEPKTLEEEQRRHSADTVRRASSIARQTMSPFCPGRTLSDCPSEYAAEWRRDIREMVSKGMSPSEIQATLERRAGGNLSGIPNRGSSYAVPIGLSFAAAIFLGAIFMRLQRKGEKRNTKESSTPPPIREVDDDRLAAELEAEESDD